MLDAVLLTDGSLKQEQLNLQTVATLADAGPWGNGFAEPLFVGEFKLVNQRVVGQDHLKLVLGLNDQLIDAIAFRQKPLDGQPEHVKVVYKPALNDYADQQTLQLVVEYIEAMS
jgi:single-stranded-DNA-specific exonuclease